MKESYREAFSEISDIFKLMPTVMLDKIPSRFKQIIEQEKSTTYSARIQEPLEECVLKEETIIILALIYRDFLCDKTESEQLKLRDARKIREAEDELREKYNPDDIFKNKRTSKSNVNNTENYTTNLPATIKQEPLYKKILSIIKKFLHFT
ncbi:MAG: hypothetical protein IKF17_01340 [Clostridia bacterium]|nr:hypothetical protein [Clostridia bacterium]